MRYRLRYAVAEPGAFVRATEKQGPHGRRALLLRVGKRLELEAYGAAPDLVENVERQLNDVLIFNWFDNGLRKIN